MLLSTYWLEKYSPKKICKTKDQIIMALVLAMCGLEAYLFSNI